MTYKEFIMAYALGALDHKTLIELSVLARDKRILAILSRDESSSVRWGIAGNLNTPIEILRNLRVDDCASIRVAAMRNKMLGI